MELLFLTIQFKDDYNEILYDKHTGLLSLSETYLSSMNTTTVNTNFQPNANDCWEAIFQ